MKQKTLLEILDQHDSEISTQNVIDKMRPKSLQERFNQCVLEYVNLFCEKQEMDFSYWIGGHIGQICEINDFILGFQEIQYDIDNNIEKGMIVDWYDENLAGGQSINYHSFCRGLRVSDIKKKK